MRLRRRRASGWIDDDDGGLRRVGRDLAGPFLPADHLVARQAAAARSGLLNRERRMDPRDKVALITGGARLGETVAVALALRGCHVALTYRGSRQSAERTAREARALGVRAAAI